MTAGKLILVVGPSGAGKDTVLNFARGRLLGNPRFKFPRRVITRPVDATEDHECVTPAAFHDRDFALSWVAHGLHYGIPREIEAELTGGGVVIANVSRGIVEAARARFDCMVVEITAPPDVLAARLIARRREDAADITARIAREKPSLRVDAVILNDTTPERAGAAFLALLQAGFI